MVEAAFVLPVVMIVLLVLFYMCLIQIQQAVMHMQASNLATKLCNFITFPGYEKFYTYTDEFGGGNKSLTLPYDFVPDKELLEEIYKIHDPYRYLGGVYLDEYSDYELLANDIFKDEYFLSDGDVSTDIYAKIIGLSTCVTVSITYDFELPRFVRLVGVDEKISIKSEATSYASDSSEFVKNVDLTFELTDFLLEKYDLKNGLTTYYKKIQEFRKNLF